MYSRSRPAAEGQTSAAEDGRVAQHVSSERKKSEQQLDIYAQFLKGSMQKSKKSDVMMSAENRHGEEEERLEKPRDRDKRTFQQHSEDKRRTEQRLAKLYREKQRHVRQCRKEQRREEERHREESPEEYRRKFLIEAERRYIEIMDIEKH
jgi:hypothetical protein